MTETDGIVLAVQEYKEHDGLVTLLTGEELLRIRVRGLQKSTSKLRSCCQPFSYVSWQIEQKKSMPFLVHGTCHEYYYRISENLESQCIAFTLRDMIFRSGTDDSVYDAFLRFLRQAHKTSNAMTEAVMSVRSILEHDGIQPYTDGCILCHRTDRIHALSIKQGGFLCQSCNDKRNDIMTKEQLIKVHSIFHYREKDLDKLKEICDFTIKDFLYWCDWYEYHSTAHLKSLVLLKDIV